MKMYGLVNRAAVTPSTLGGLILPRLITHGARAPNNEALRGGVCCSTRRNWFSKWSSLDPHTNRRRNRLGSSARAPDDASESAFLAVSEKKGRPSFPRSVERSPNRYVTRGPSLVRNFADNSRRIYLLGLGRKRRHVTTESAAPLVGHRVVTEYQNPREATTWRLTSHVFPSLSLPT